MDLWEILLGKRLCRLAVANIDEARQPRMYIRLLAGGLADLLADQLLGPFGLAVYGCVDSGYDERHD